MTEALLVLAAALAVLLAAPLRAELTLPKAAEPGLYRGMAGEQADFGPAASTTLRLGLDLYGKLSAAKPTENVILSPVSAAQALAAAYNGAGGDTAREMAEVLGLTGSLEAVNASQAGLREVLGRAGGVTMTSANSLWADKVLVLRVDFVERLRRFFAAEAASLDFSDPSAVGTINGWVRRNTNGRIPAAVHRLPDDGGLLLVNALYFKGTWSDEFDPQGTREKPFRLASGKTVPRRRMSRSGWFAYAEEQG